MGKKSKSGGLGLGSCGRIPAPGNPPASGRRRFYTTSQLMARWGVSVATIIRLIDEGQLRGLKIRGVYRVDSDSVERYEKKVAF
ncbi:MAG: helix-turn-helix domain-containing protein [Nitrospinae bacterium]|nr:helix-turn-helix domain-containing protein [Nitrospinota bacterium]